MSKNYSSMKAEALRAECKARKLKGYSGLTKENLVRLLTAADANKVDTFRPTFKPGTAGALRQECRELREVAKATGDKAYSGYSSLNKAGLAHMVAHSGAKPTLKDNTFKAGTVGWLQQFCRENSIAKFSGKKKADLIALVRSAGWTVDDAGVVSGKTVRQAA